MNQVATVDGSQSRVGRPDRSRRVAMSVALGSLALFFGLANRQQQQVIEYLRTENYILREKLGE